MKPFEEYDWSMCRFPKEYAKAVFDLCQRKQFKRGLEVGFDSGTSALAFLRALPEASLVSIDIAHCPEGADLVTSLIEDWQERHVFLAEADSRWWLPELLNKHDRYDYIYIDGDHLYDVVKADLNNAFPLLTEDGIMVVDDCDPNHTHFGVWQAVQEWRAEHPQFQVSELPGTQSCHVILSR